MSALRDRHARFAEALQAFDTPTVDEVAGLRLMREALRERTEHLAQTVEAEETLQLEVELAGEAVGGLEATVATVVLAALQDAVTAAARAIAPEQPAGAVVLVLAAVEPLEPPLEGGRLVLRRRPGPLEALAPDPGSPAPLVERAIDEVLAALSAEEVPDRLAVAVDALLRALAAAPASAVLRTAPAVLEPREVVVTPAEAVRRTT